MTNSENGAEDTNPRRYTRRLSDKVLVAFHQACDQSEYEIAQQLLNILETLVARSSSHSSYTRRRSIGTLVAAYERLWHLRHKGPHGA
jgi:hypothetical protein